MEAASNGNCLQGRINCFPVDVIESGVGPVVRDEFVAFLRILDDVLAYSGSSSRGGNIIVVGLGDQFAIVEESSFRTGDPIGEASNVARMLTVRCGTNVIGNTIGKSRDR